MTDDASLEAFASQLHAESVEAQTMLLRELELLEALVEKQETILQSEPESYRVVASPMEAIEKWQSRSRQDIEEFFKGQITINIRLPDGGTDDGKVLQAAVHSAKAQVKEIVEGFQSLGERFDGKIKPSLNYTLDSGRLTVSSLKDGMDSLAEFFGSVWNNAEFFLCLILVIMFGYFLLLALGHVIACLRFLKTKYRQLWYMVLLYMSY